MEKSDIPAAIVVDHGPHQSLHRLLTLAILLTAIPALGHAAAILLIQVVEADLAILRPLTLHYQPHVAVDLTLVILDLEPRHVVDEFCFYYWTFHHCHQHLINT